MKTKSESKYLTVKDFPTVVPFVFIKEELGHKNYSKFYSWHQKNKLQWVFEGVWAKELKQFLKEHPIVKEHHEA